MRHVAGHALRCRIAGAFVALAVVLSPLNVVAQEVVQLIKKGEKLYQAGNFAQALEHFQRARDLTPGVYGRDTLNTAKILHNLAFFYDSMGQYGDAESLYQQSLKIKKEKLAGDDPSLLLTLANLGVVYQSLSQYDKAEPLLLKCLEVREGKYDPDHPVLADSLNNLGMLYKDMGQYEKAEKLLRRSLQSREGKHGRNHLDTANSFNNLAHLYTAMGRYAEAKDLLLESLHIRETKLAPDDPLVANSLNNLAHLYQTLGQYTEAEPLLQRSLEIRTSRHGPDHPDVAIGLNNLALLYQAMGQYSQAETLLRRALRIREARLPADHPDRASTLNDLGTLYRSVGQYAKAEPLYQLSLNILEARLGKDHPQVATVVNNLADLYKSVGRYAEAAPLYERSLSINEAKLGKDHPEVAHVLNNLAKTYTAMARYTEAEPLYQRSLAIKEGKLGKDHPNVAYSLNNLADLYTAMGQYSKAKPLYWRGLRIREAKLHKDHPDLAASFYGLAFLHAAQDDWEEASRQTEAMRRIVRTHVARTLPILADQEQLDFLEEKDHPRFHVAQSLALTRQLDSKAVALSAGWVLNGKAVAQESLAEAVLLARGASDAKSTALVRQLTDARRQLAQLTLAEPTPGQEDQRSQYLAELSAKGSELAQQLRQATPGTGQKEPWVPLAEVRRALPADSVLIEVSRFRLANFKAKGDEKKWHGDHYAAWVIPATTEGDVRLIDLGDANSIEAAVARVRYALLAAQGTSQHESTIKQLGEKNAESQLRQPLQALSQLVLEPLAEHISSKKSWIISPDASLWLVPWAALLLKDGTYAIENHEISYVVSGRDLVRDVPNIKTTRPIMMADPDFDMEVESARAENKDLVNDLTPPIELRGLPRSLGSIKVRRLPGFAAEAEAIKPNLEKYAGEEPRVLTGKLALEKEFKAIQSPKVLVLCTHGFFLEDQQLALPERIDLVEKPKTLTKLGRHLENPLLRCGLLLAGCNQRERARQAGDEDGVLTGLEIVGTDLRGTELVVLSACETGLGQVHNGEGVAGLRQAFQLAGAQSVVATLWQIPDRESARLMSAFFENLATGQSKAEALRQAQLTMIQQHRQRDDAAHPFFWAAFTLTGK